MRLIRFIILLVAVIGFAVSSASALTLPCIGAGDGSAGRDWYSSPNYYWADTANPTVDFTHHGSDRWSLRGGVIIDISSLAGATLPPGSTTFSFYSFGISGTSLQHLDGDPGSTVTTAFATAGGTEIAPLNIGEGWQSYDVTSLIANDIASGRNHVGFVFAVTSNNCGGSIAASEDAFGRGAFIQTVPEPGSLVGLLAGFPALALWGLKRRGK